MSSSGSVCSSERWAQRYRHHRAVGRDCRILGGTPCMGVALPCHFTWIECLGTFTPRISITRWGNGHFGELRALWRAACPVPSEGLGGYLGTLPPSLFWREVRHMYSFCLCHLLQSLREATSLGAASGLQGWERWRRASMSSVLTSFLGWAAPGSLGLLPWAPRCPCVYVALFCTNCLVF